MANRGDFFVPLPHKGQITTISAGSLSYEALIDNLQSSVYNRQKFVPAGYAHSPDLIADLFFDGASSWWAVMEINGLSDPFEDLNLNDMVYLPDE